MNLNNISYPYPVLGSFDDILPLPKDPSVKLEDYKDNFHFDIKLAYNNEKINSLVENDFADYACEVVCEQTRFRKCYKGKQKRFQIDLPKKSVAGRIDFTCTITVKKFIRNYTNEGFHADYLGHTFNMEPGDILGIFTPFYYYADIKYERLKAVGSFMEITETEDDIPTTILDKDKIELRLPKKLFNQYKNNASIYNKADILHASLVLNSLTYALSRFKNYKRRKWAETIDYRINTEPEMKEFKEEDPDCWKVDKLAQLLLGRPYERLFNYLSNNDNQE